MMLSSWKALFVLMLCSRVASMSDPTGHMMPFGHHRPPSVIIDEFEPENAPKPEEFYETYVKKDKAVIFRGGASNSGAFKLWNDDYVREKFGEEEVRLEGKYEKKHLPPVGEKYLGRDTIRHFVDTYHDEGNRVYVVSDLPEKMYADVEVPPSLGSCGEMSKNVVEVNIWWSGGGSASVIHKDAYHQLNCLLNGTKYWTLIEKKYEKQIYKHPEPDYEQGGFSDINAKQVDLKRYPMIKMVQWSNITLHPGDCIFLPKEYYHQVNSSGTHNMAVSLLFSRFDDRDSLDFSDCDDSSNYKNGKSLSEFDVQLVWRGKGSMVMGRADLELGYREQFLEAAREAELEGYKIDFDLWSQMLSDNVPVEKDIMRSGDIKKGFQLIDKDGDGFMSVQELEGLTRRELLAISDEIEPWEPSNEYEYEYSIVPFEKVWGLIRAAMQYLQVLTIDEWLKYYTKMGGSTHFGTMTFHRLSAGKDSVRCSDLTLEGIHKALDNNVKY